MAKKLPPAEMRQKLVEQGALPKPGEGPDRETRKKHTFEITFLGETTQGQRLFTSVRGNDMYEFTALSAIEAALLLIQKRDQCCKKLKSFLSRV